MPEKRKDIRIRHRETVELDAESASIEGNSINISRIGMQVVVKAPESCDAVRSITFTLPGSGERIQLPCRLVRNSKWGDSGDRLLGIEFLERTESQILLIDNFIKELQGKQQDPRQIPRTSCHIVEVSTDSPEVQILSIENLSVDGLLVSYVGELRAGDPLALSLAIPGDARPLRLQGSIVYVIENVFREPRTAGVRLARMTEVEVRRLSNLVVACASGSIIRDLYHHLQALPRAQEYSIADSRKIAQTLLSLKAHCVPVSLLHDGSIMVEEHSIAEVNEDRQEFSISLTPENPPHGGGAGRAAYFSFSWSGSSYYFKTEAADSRLDGVTFRLPTLMFRSENRSYQRKLLGADSDQSITISAEECPLRTFSGILVDIGRRGFLCEILVPPDCQALFQQGKVVRYVADERLGLDHSGQVRHARAFSSPDGFHLRLGIEAGIERRAVPVRRMNADEWQREMPYQGGAGGPSRSIESLRVRFLNSKGQEICGLVNATALPVEAPVVIIPPAYGKKKEAYSPLVATLLASFWAYGKDLAILRYDGINRPGESHQDEANPKRGYEMLAYRWGQGLDDLRAALSFVRDNPHFMAR